MLLDIFKFSKQQRRYQLAVAGYNKYNTHRNNEMEISLIPYAT